MNIKRNIIFALENRKKDGIPITQNVPIRMRVVFASQRIEFTTGYRIDMEKWDADKQRVRNGCTNKLKQSASEINTELLRQYTEIQNVFKEFEVQDIMPTPAQIKEAFNLKMKGEKEESHHEKEEVKLDFMKIFDEFVAECSKQNDWSSSTLKKFATVKKHIATFDPNTTFESWTERHFNEYIDYLRSDKDMRNTSIAKQIKFLKWFLRWTNRKGYHQNTAYDKFMPKMKSAPKKVIFLTRNELDKIRACQIPAAKQYLERVRDVLLFCCFTGLRHSDVYNLKRSDVKEEHIEITTIKTADSLIIELNDHSKAILEKYKDLVVIKSISKSYGVPGLRLGVACSSDIELINKLKKELSIWNINSFGEFYMQLFGKYSTDYQKACELFREERKRFYHKLQDIPYLKVFPSQANFFLCEIIEKYTSDELGIQLLKRNILISNCNTKSHIDTKKQFIRIAIRDQKDNNKLISALKCL